MKKFYSFISSFILSVCLYAQAPQSFSYQAVIRGMNNSLVVNKPVGMKISLLHGSENGTVTYTETHSPTANENGLVSISIGSGKVETGVFSIIDWSKGPYFLKTEIDPAGGSSYSINSVSQLLSVPYALNSGNGYSRVSKNGDTLYFENNKFVIIPGISMANLKTSGYGDDIYDIENNKYKTVYIGTQTWMAENLKVSKYNDGTVIPNVTDNVQWSNLTTGAWSYYDNDASNNTKYGKLYNWYTVSKTTNGDKNVCPIGWHMPTITEWTVLFDYLGGNEVAGEKMRTTELNSWDYPNDIATNSSLFFGLPSGIRNNGGHFNDLKKLATWWSANNYDSITSIFLYLLPAKNGPNSCSICSYNTPNQSGLSIRCVKD